MRRLEVVTLWSRRSEYRLVPSKTGKLPLCEASVWKLPGTLLPGKRAAAGQEPGLHPDGKPAQVEVAPRENTWATPVGHTPFTACPDEAPARPAYSPMTCALVGLVRSPPRVAGLVRN